jgi:ABC-type molybdenum transport system ATPase subunit/photorepair protein PhrA
MFNCGKNGLITDMKLEEEFPDYDNCYFNPLDVENINFIDSKIKILNNISLTVNQGERHFLLRDQTDLEKQL